MSETRWPASSALTAGVKLPVQVMPPLALLSVPTVPPCTVKSVWVNPVTASLKVTVTVGVSPALMALLDKAMVAVGAWVSTA